MEDFAGVLSQRLDLVAKDLEFFSHSQQVDTAEPEKAAAPYEMKAWV